MKIDYETKFSTGDCVVVKSDKSGGKCPFDAWGYKTWIGTTFTIESIEVRFRWQKEPPRYRNLFPIIEYSGMVNEHDSFRFDERQLLKA